MFFLRNESKYGRLNQGPTAGKTWDQVKNWLVDEGLIEESQPFSATTVRGLSLKTVDGLRVLR